MLVPLASPSSWLDFMTDKTIGCMHISHGFKVLVRIRWQGIALLELCDKQYISISRFFFPLKMEDLRSYIGFPRAGQHKTFTA